MPKHSALKRNSRKKAKESRKMAGLEDKLFEDIEKKDEDFAQFQVFRENYNNHTEFMLIPKPKYAWLEPAIRLANNAMPMLHNGMLGKPILGPLPEPRTVTSATKPNPERQSEKAKYGHEDSDNHTDERRAHQRPQTPPPATSGSGSTAPLLPFTMPLAAAGIAASRGWNYASVVGGATVFGLGAGGLLKYLKGSSSEATSPSQQGEITTTAATDDVDVKDVIDIYETTSLRLHEEPRTVDDNMVENNREVGEPVVRSRRSASDNENNRYIPDFMQTIIKRKGLSNDVIIRSILDGIHSDSTVMGLNEHERKKIFLIKTLQYLSVLTLRYSRRVVMRYQPFIDALWSEVNNMFVNVPEREEIGSYIPEKLEVSEENTEPAISDACDLDAQERIKAAFGHLMSTADTLRTPVLNMGEFIDTKITEAIQRFNDSPMRYNPQGKWPGQDPWESYNRTPTPEVTPDTRIQIRVYSDGLYYSSNMTLRDIIMGKHIHLRNEKGSRAQVFIDDHNDMLSWIRKKYGLEEKVIQAVRDLKNDESKVNVLAEYNEGMMRLRCVEYIIANEGGGDTEYTQAVNDFLEGEIQAREVFFNGVKLNDALMIPIKDTKKGILFSVNESAYFEIKEDYLRNANLRTLHKYSTFPANDKFEKWVLARIPVYNRQNSPFQPNSTWTRKRTNGPLGSSAMVSNFKHPFSFTASSSHSDIARKLVTGLLDRLESDADSLIRSEQEDNTERWLEIGQVLTMYAAIMLLPVSIGATGPVATALSMGGMVATDAAYVFMALEKAKNADTAGEASAHRINALLAGVLAGLGHGATGAVMIKPAASRLLSLYRQAKLSMKSGTVAAIGQYGWKKLDDTEKVRLMKDVLSSTQAARQRMPKGVSAAIIDQIRVATLARKELPFSVAQGQIQRLLEGELRELEQADSVLEKYLDSPLLLPKEDKKHSHFVGQWTYWGQDLNRLAVNRIVRDFNSDEYRDIFNMDTITTIHNEITWGGDDVVRNLGSSGSSLRRAGFTEALNKIRTLDQYFQGQALYTAVMHYKPFATNNKPMARIMYLLGELRRLQTLRHGALMVAPLSEEAEAILSRKFSLPEEHAISQQEEVLVLNDMSNQIVSDPDSEYEFQIGGTTLLGKRENGVFCISRDNGKTWQESDSKILLTAWSLQNAGGKNKAWSLPMGLTGNQRSRPIPGNVGENTYGRDIPVVRSDLNEAGEWEGASGTLPGTDEQFFQAVTQQRGAVDADEINYKLLEQMRLQDTQEPKKPFMRDGIAIHGRVHNEKFEISADDGLTWQRGTVWDEFSYRMQTKPLLSFGLKYFNELRDASTWSRVSRVAHKVAEDNQAAFIATGRQPKDPLAPYGAGESWDSVFKLEKKSGLMTLDEYKQVKETILADSRIFVGAPYNSINSMDMLNNIKAGARIILTDAEDELVHAMISGGSGIAYSSNNYLLGGPSYWSKIDFSETFTGGIDGVFYINPDKTPFPGREYRIRADFYSLPSVRFEDSFIPPAARDVIARGKGTIGTVADLGDGTVEKVFSVPSANDNGPRMASARNNAEGFNRYYGSGSGSAMVIPVTQRDGTILYQAKNILRKVPGVSLDNISDINVFKAMKIDIARKNPVESLTEKLRAGGITHNDINVGNIMYDKTTGEFNLIDFDSATYTDKSVDGSIPPLSVSQTKTMRDKLRIFLGDTSIQELMTRKQLTTKWRDLPSSMVCVPKTGIRIKRSPPLCIQAKSYAELQEGDIGFDEDLVDDVDGKVDGPIVKQMENINLSPTDTDEVERLVQRAEFNEQEVTLWRGTTEESANRIAMFESGGGATGVNPYVEPVSRERAQLQIKKGREEPEYTSDPHIGDQFSRGHYLVIVDVKVKYLTKGSESESGWIIPKTAPVRVRAIVDRRYGQGEVLGANASKK